MVDLKTGASAPSVDDAAEHPQLAAYQVAVEAGAFPEGTESGGAEIVAVGTSHANAAVRGAAAAVRSRRSRAGPRRWCGEAATAMAASTFRAVVNDSCPYCAVRTSCPLSGKGRQVRAWMSASGTSRGSTVYRPAGSSRRRSCALRLGHRATSSAPSSCEVISAPADEPLLVVAGAGSGKTELMALRVVWLIANAYVRPDQVLGLTFTRKAAGELSHRIRLYLGRAKQLLGHDAQLAGEPTVATYHSFAARVVREHGMRAGFEPTVRLLTEAACWQIADAVVRQHDSPAMRGVPARPGQRHRGRARSRPASWPSTCATRRTSSGSPLGLTGRGRGRLRRDRIYKPVQDVLDRQRGPARAAAAGARVRRAQGRAWRRWTSATSCAGRPSSPATTPRSADAERDRFRVVLLDEYQDTSQAQVALLRPLFGGGHPVTAVGDPCQSIYGWRGASAGTLDRVPH